MHRTQSGVGSFGIGAEGRSHHYEVLRKAGANLLAKAVFPTERHLKQAMAYMDLGVKVELMMFEMYANLFWNSVLELVIFGVLLLLFIIDAARLAGIWFWIVHVVRGIIGIIILRNLPMTHEIIKTASIPDEEHLEFDKVFEYIAFAAKESLDHFTVKTKRLLKVYFCMTIVCIIIDLLFFLSNFRYYSDETRSAYMCTLYLMASTSYLIIDFFYIIWLLSLKTRMPTYISASFMQISLGALDYIYKSIGNYLDRQRVNREIELNRGQMELRGGQQEL